MLSRKFKKLAGLSITSGVVGLVLSMALFASSASAASNPFMKAWKHQPGAQVGVSEAHSSSAVVVLQDVKLKGTEKQSPKCHWMNGWNSGETASGELYWFYDHHMYVCPNKNSPTGWAKVKGGITGRDCGNPVKAGPPPQEQPKIIIVRTFGKFKAVANAHAREKVHGSCGTAEATATAHGMAYGVTRVQAKSNANFVANAKAQASAYAKAQVALVCSPQPQAPPVVTPEIPKPPAEIICEFGEVKNAQGNCVKQENKAEQTCEVNLNGNWNSVTQKCEITQINGNCSTIVVLKEVYVEGPLTINVENETCVVKEEPCGCSPPPKEVEPPVVHLETIQEIEVNEVRVICAHVESPNNDPVTVHFEAEYGTFANGGTGSAVSGGRSCATYTGPTEPPKNASHCDTIEVLVRDTTTGKSATDKKSVEIIEETPL